MQNRHSFPAQRAFLIASTRVLQSFLPACHVFPWLSWKIEDLPFFFCTFELLVCCLLDKLNLDLLVVILFLSVTPVGMFIYCGGPFEF